MQSSASGGSEQADLTLLKVTQPVIDTDDIPDALKDLCSIAEINSSNDAFIILLHAFMLEAGFFPRDIPESKKLKFLPKNWHEKELYSIVYCHSSCPEVCCSMTCFPLAQQLSVFGTVSDLHTSKEPPNICLQVSPYVNNCNLKSSDPSKIFSNVKEVSQSFKDGFAYPLLAVTQDALGFGPTFGITATTDDVKVLILSFLPVGGLVAISCVNKEFHELCNLPSLWKKLYLKDFPSGDGDCEESNQDWKKLYKEKYLKQKLTKQFFFSPRPRNVVRCFGLPLPRAPEFEPDFSFGIPDMRVRIPDLQPEARPHNVIRRPPFPHNPLLNIPHIFQF